MAAAPALAPYLHEKHRTKVLHREKLMYHECQHCKAARPLFLDGLSFCVICLPEEVIPQLLTQTLQWSSHGHRLAVPSYLQNMLKPAN